MKSVNCVNGSGKSIRLSTRAFVFVFMVAILTTLVAAEGIALAHDADEQSTNAATRHKCRVYAKGLTTLESDFEVDETVLRLKEERGGPS